METYKDVYRAYRLRGFSPVPIRPGRKTPAAPKWQHAAEWTPADYERIAVKYSQCGVGLVGGEFIALDVDAAADHKKDADGVTAFAWLQHDLGALPPTYTNTARGKDSPARHWLYRIPAAYKGMKAHSPAAGIDIREKGGQICVWPTMHPTGRQYVWYAPSGDETGIPSLGELPELPTAWADMIYRPAGLNQESTSSIPLNPTANGSMCKAVTTALGKWTADPGRKGSRHDTTRDAVHKLANMHAEGHKGALEAIEAIGAQYAAMVADARDGGQKTAEDEYRRMVDGMTAQLAATPAREDPCDTYRPTPPPRPAFTAPMADAGDAPTGRHAMLTDGTAVTIDRPTFLGDPMLPTGVITLIAGRAGVSKSTLSIHYAAQVTQGTLEGDYHGHPQTVVFSAIEDGKGMQAARLKAAGADMSRVRFLDMSDTINGTPLESGVRIPEDLDTIRGALADCGAKLWIIDPITSAMAGNTNKRDDVRGALDPLAALARDLDLAVVGILHFNKGGGYASDKISGSHAFRDTVRSLILVARDDETHDCIATLDKSSYTPSAGQSWVYGLASQAVDTADGQTMSVPVVSGLMPTDRTVGEIINRNEAAGSVVAERAEHGEVFDWLTAYLEDNGPTPYRTLLHDAKDEQGYTDRQLRNAREQAHGPWIVTEKDPDHKGPGRAMLWRLSRTPPDD
ncbi:AAA family ATPase [Bifidobacterium cuniculi]|uniref:ATP-dependent serine protease n=1 Tax=Bifidobacterium cuniculi TaxID=1688 RepID=A0A087AHS0_9BIFI|nr:AAA family ATPase [Bifidobacterium cuniculi]KFI58320.1 ATP-dependent serine protease [Bifidobacterium cuniculi]